MAAFCTSEARALLPCICALISGHMILQLYIIQQVCIEAVSHAVHGCTGQLVFQGPKEEVLPFFETLGFRPPPRQGAADFLQEVVSRRDQPVRTLRRLDAPLSAGYI